MNTRRILALGLLLAFACSHRERQQELLDKVRKEQAENAPAVPPANEPISLGSAQLQNSVTIQFLRYERPPGRDPRMILTVQNNGANPIRDIQGQVVIQTEAGSFQMGYEIPLEVQPKSSREYAMDVVPRWDKTAAVTGATFTVTTVKAPV